MKNFVNAICREGNCFNYLKEIFSQLRDAKLTEDKFIGSQIRKLLDDSSFQEQLNGKESAV